MLNELAYTQGAEDGMAKFAIPNHVIRRIDGMPNLSGQDRGRLIMKAIDDEARMRSAGTASKMVSVPVGTPGIANNSTQIRKNLQPVISAGPFDATHITGAPLPPELSSPGLRSPAGITEGTVPGRGNPLLPQITQPKFRAITRPID